MVTVISVLLSSTGFGLAEIETMWHMANAGPAKTKTKAVTMTSAKMARIVLMNVS
jgi:hypothetical protein